MCGIVAVRDLNGANILQMVQSALRALRHRGPDGCATWISPSGAVALGHARLAIHDVRNGAQPMGNEDGSVVAVVNGEFYDIKPIRAELTRCGHKFKTNSDSEILVHLYERDGYRCLEHLHGEFAFVLWDANQNVLWAARDRFGIKPLYYFEDSHRIVLSSEIKALKSAGVDITWDPDGFFEKFIFQTCLGGRTLYRGVRELPPGCYLVQKGQTSTIERYWDLNYSTVDTEANSINGNSETWASSLLTALDQAVRSRLQTDHPVACYLSGGLDSTSVCALVQRNLGYPAQAFSIGFEDPEYDESSEAQESAAELGMEFNKVLVTTAMLAHGFEQTAGHCETLLFNANSVAKVYLSRAVRDAGFRVALTGEGADELFAGYPTFTVDCIRHGSPAEKRSLQQLLGKADHEMQDLLYPNGYLSAPSLISHLGFIPSWMEARYWTLEEFSPIFRERLTDRDLGYELINSLGLSHRWSGSCVLQRSLYIQSKTVLPGVTLSSLGDRVEMAHSIEGRVPFLDHRVVNLALRLPCSMKIQNGVEKFTLRRAMRGLIPPAVCGRRKRGILAPQSVTLRSSLFGEMLQDNLRGSALESLPFLDRSAVCNYLDRIPSLEPDRQKAWDGPLTALASACVLSRKLLSA